LTASNYPQIPLTSQIVSSKWANRHEQSFLSPDFIKLKAEIDGAGGNVQPIKVRPLADQPGKYEIVFGHRRHQACLDLGLPVLAMIENLSEQELFSQMDRENRSRADLRPYEQGVMYAKALDGGLFPSMRKMADALGVSQPTVSTAIALARIPNEILSAFQSPLDLQFRWSKPLTDAIETNPELVIDRAQVINGLSPRPSAPDVFKKLTDKPSITTEPVTPSKVSIKGKGDQAGQVLFNPKKKSFEITLSGVPQDRMQELEEAIRKLLS